MINSLRLLCRSLILTLCLLILAPAVPGVAQKLGDATQAIKVLPRYIWGMAFSPDGRFLAGMSEADVVIWAVQKLHVAKVLTLTCGPPVEIAWSPDSRYLATAASGGFGRVRTQIIVWRIDTWQPVALYHTHGNLDGCAFVADKPEMIVMANDRTTVLWDFARNKTVRREVWPGDQEAAYRVPWVHAYLRPEWTHRDFRSYHDAISPLDGAVASLRHSDRKLTLTPSSQKAPRIPFLHALPWYPAMTAYRADPPEKVTPWISAKAASGTPLAPAEIAAVAPNHIARYDSGIVHRIALAIASPPNNRTGGSDIVVQRSDGRTVKTRSYHVPDYPIHLSLSPDGKYLAYMMGPEPDDPGMAHAYRVLDLAGARLSSCATTESHDGRIAWSPDSQYLSLYDAGLDWSKYSTPQVLLCWDFKRNRSQAVVTAWRMKDHWTSGGRLRFHVEYGGSGEFDPATGIITVLSDTQDGHPR